MSTDTDKWAVETTVGRLATMFSTVSDPAVKQDCATVDLTTTGGELTIEYGAFDDGAVLNVPTATSQHTVEDVAAGVSIEPKYSGEGFVVFGVDDLNEPEAAEVVLDACSGWSGVEIADADLRTIESGGLTQRLVEQVTGIVGRSE